MNVHMFDISPTALIPSNVYLCVAGHPVWRDAFSSGPSVSGQRHCIKSCSTHIRFAAAALLALQSLRKESVVLDAL
jgi:hypothetical protein